MSPILRMLTLGSLVFTFGIAPVSHLSAAEKGKHKDAAPATTGPTISNLDSEKKTVTSGDKIYTTTDTTTFTINGVAGTFAGLKIGQTITVDADADNKAKSITASDPAPAPVPGKKGKKNK